MWDGSSCLAIAMMGEGTKEIIAYGWLAAIENVNVINIYYWIQKKYEMHLKHQSFLFANSDHINKIRNNHRFDLDFRY